VWRGLYKKVATGCPRAKEGRCPGTCEGSCVSKIAYACAADDPSVPEAVHRYARLAFRAGPAIANMSVDPAVIKLDSLARLVVNECERTRQFTRFSQLADGSYLASFRPKADTVPLVSGYFAKRMMPERFCLVDPVHCVAALHEADAKRCQVVHLDQTLADELAARDDFSSDEQYIRAMWKRLYDGLTLDGRGKDERGYDLRASWMPKRFWDGLFELDPRSANPGSQVPRRYQGARKDALIEG
jgi:probable DNA metabolism protein